MSGQYKPGESLPPHQTLAERYGVSVGTIKSALSIMRDRALVVSRQGMRASVRSDLQPDALDTGPLVGLSDRNEDLAEIHVLLREMNNRLKAIEGKLSS